VLDDLPALVEAEDVDAGPVAVPGPSLEAVQHDVGALGDRALDVHALVRVFPGHPGEELDEPGLAVGDAGVVLDVDVAHVPLDRLGGPALIEHQVIEGHRVPLVLLEHPPSPSDALQSPPV
jgi:hypothetical protein